MFLNKYRYSIKLYIGNTISTSLALSICMLFISLMHLINGTQFLNSTFIFLLFGAASVPVLLTVIVPLTIMYASL